jgi:hypothetical protein
MVKTTSLILIAEVFCQTGQCYKANKSVPLISAKAEPVGAFKSVETGIGSWFRSDNHNDNTTGRSWCGYPYKDYTNGFAPVSVF